MNPHRLFAGRAGAGSDVAETVGAGYINRLLDGSNVGGTGKRSDDAGGAENGQATDDAQARIQSCLLYTSRCV